MNVLEKAIATDWDYCENTALVNALIYKLSKKLGKQLASARFVDLLDETDASIPALAPSLETVFIAMNTRMKTALETFYAGEFDKVEVDSNIARWILEKDGFEPTQYIGVRVSVRGDGELRADFYADLAILEDDFIPVNFEHLPTPDTVTVDEPIRYLDMAALKQLCGVDEVTDEVLESVSIAALALGWVDTDTFGKTMILIG